MNYRTFSVENRAAARTLAAEVQALGKRPIVRFDVETGRIEVIWWD